MGFDQDSLGSVWSGCGGACDRSEVKIQKFLAFELIYGWHEWKGRGDTRYQPNNQMRVRELIYVDAKYFNPRPLLKS